MIKGGAIIYDDNRDNYLPWLLDALSEPDFPRIKVIGDGAYSATFTLRLPEPNKIYGIYPGISNESIVSLDKVLVKIIPIADKETEHGIVTEEHYNDEVEMQKDVYDKTNDNLEPLCPKILHHTIVDSNANQIEFKKILDCTIKINDNKKIKININNDIIKKYGIIFMEFVDGSTTLSERIKWVQYKDGRKAHTHNENDTISFIYEYKRLIQSGYINADLHEQNILYIENYHYSENYKFRLVFIDFGIVFRIKDEYIQILLNVFDTGEIKTKIQDFLWFNNDNDKFFYNLNVLDCIKFLKTNVKKYNDNNNDFIAKILQNSIILVDHYNIFHQEFRYKVNEMQNERTTQINLNTEHFKKIIVEIKDKKYKLLKKNKIYELVEDTKAVSNTIDLTKPSKTVIKTNTLETNTPETNTPETNTPETNTLETNTLETITELPKEEYITIKYVKTGDKYKIIQNNTK